MAVGEYISVASQKDSEKVTFAGIACSDAAHFAPCLAAYTEYVAPQMLLCKLYCDSAGRIRLGH